ncbi:hypothetical protein L3V82_00660 [Thiotrichales bacterium 19S3-7]|nr:hypothetical protein [Thiotrichales bacterium 19S3-7]MCF6800674.1 hypothetical protein [Thiotrichales bacterium 19S3-11]
MPKFSSHKQLQSDILTFMGDENQFKNHRDMEMTLDAYSFSGYRIGLPFESKPKPYQSQAFTLHEIANSLGNIASLKDQIAHTPIKEKIKLTQLQSRLEFYENQWQRNQDKYINAIKDAYYGLYEHSNPKDKAHYQTLQQCAQWLALETDILLNDKDTFLIPDADPRVIPNHTVHQTIRQNADKSNSDLITIEGIGAIINAHNTGVPGMPNQSSTNYAKLRLIDNLTSHIQTMKSDTFHTKRSRKSQAINNFIKALKTDDYASLTSENINDLSSGRTGKLINGFKQIIPEIESGLTPQKSSHSPKTIFSKQERKSPVSAIDFHNQL